MTRSDKVEGKEFSPMATAVAADTPDTTAEQSRIASRGRAVANTITRDNRRRRWMEQWNVSASECTLVNVNLQDLRRFAIANQGQGRRKPELIATKHGKSLMFYIQDLRIE